VQLAIGAEQRPCITACGLGWCTEDASYYGIENGRRMRGAMTVTQTSSGLGDCRIGCRRDEPVLSVRTAVNRS